ncbi:glycine betaine ABC transporter substrate-binding protein [Bacillus dakarensis]|uniref:glycine betaine ABC transporter substrate-binding protein n=1 Tax=Robertmurraya dakarensis TaxID=1926278 RepID=UPI0009817C94|nr:glycine betaine ABC transporter substrate-binding protein [Bacillus dakarensis]
MFKRIFGVTSALALSIGLTACGGSEETTSESTSIGEQLDYQIVGIDPGAGLMDMTINKVLPEYGLDEKWEVSEGSGAAMTAALKKAYDAEEPIIVTGWIPHWKFSEFDLKMLEDPKGAFGGEEDINTIVRQGLKEDLPGAYTFFDQFQWEPEHLQDVMVKIESGLEGQEAAKEWVESNEDLVNTWIEGVEPGNGAEVKVTYVAWSDVIASSNVVKYVLENKLDYTVNLIQVDAGPMWASVADGSADAMVGAWLPTTHAAYYEEYKEDFEDLGVNLTGTRNGLVVPAYTEIDSIEDLIDEE